MSVKRRITDASRTFRDFCEGPWSCENVVAESIEASGPGAMRGHFFGFDYARIAVMSDWMPMMFMTRVRL